MLSRTADALFWLGRYNERSGNLARGIAAALRMSLIEGDEGVESPEWRSLLVASGNDGAFRARHDVATTRATVEWMTLDASNASSVAACIEAARRNARAVRTALTVDMWEAINDTWMELQRIRAASLSEERLPAFLDWVKSRSLALNGAAADTMLRDDAWRFTHLGTILERADNTARLLDARVAAFRPEAAMEPANHPRLEAVLRSVGALRAYQHVYRARLDAERVAELLLLRREVPRSLRFCYDRVDSTLAKIAAGNGEEVCAAVRGVSVELLARCERAQINDILAGGLHNALTSAINGHTRLGNEIARCFLDG